MGDYDVLKVPVVKYQQKKEDINCVSGDEMSSSREGVIAFDNMRKQNFSRVIVLEGGIEGLKG